MISKQCPYRNDQTEFPDFFQTLFHIFQINYNLDIIGNIKKYITDVYMVIFTDAHE